MSSITVQKFTFNGFQENTYLVFDGQKNAIIIDPGCYEPHEERELNDFISLNDLSVLAVINTHSHIDHVLGVQAMVNKYNCAFYVHELDIQTLESVPNYAHLYGFVGYKPAPAPSTILKGGEVLKFGEIEFKVIHAPGHAPGHVIFHFEKEGILINGDVLFQGSFGRVDLPGGSMEVLKRTIHEILFKLPENTLVYAGHGDETTIGEEKRTNYILQF